MMHETKSNLFYARLTNDLGDVMFEIEMSTSSAAPLAAAKIEACTDPTIYQQVENAFDAASTQVSRARLEAGIAKAPSLVPEHLLAAWYQLMATAKSAASLPMPAPVPRHDNRERFVLGFSSDQHCIKSGARETLRLIAHFGKEGLYTIDKLSLAFAATWHVHSFRSGSEIQEIDATIVGGFELKGMTIDSRDVTIDVTNIGPVDAQLRVALLG
jgi:hypothetical protein